VCSVGHPPPGEENPGVVPDGSDGPTTGAPTGAEAVAEHPHRPVPPAGVAPQGFRTGMAPGRTALKVVDPQPVGATVVRRFQDADTPSRSTR
jgi:hypothetical protein